MARPKGYHVHLINSPAGQALLITRGLTSMDLARAITEYQRREGVRVGTSIGVSKDGFFGSTREGWRPDHPNAFAEPLIIVPWVHILELIGRMPDGTTGEFFKYGGKPQ
jgi:hypothetical protein